MSTNLSIDAKPWTPAMTSEHTYKQQFAAINSNESSFSPFTQQQSLNVSNYSSSFAPQLTQQQQHKDHQQQQQQRFHQQLEQPYTSTPSFATSQNNYTKPSINNSSTNNTYLFDHNSYKSPDNFTPQLQRQQQHNYQESSPPSQQLYNFSSAQTQQRQQQSVSQQHSQEIAHIWHPQQQQQQQQPEHLPQELQKQQQQQQQHLFEQEQMSQPKFNPSAAKLFVGQLPYECTEEQLRRLFEAYGTVEHIHFLRDNNNRSKGAAFLTYSTVDEADTAIFTLHNRFRMLTNRAIQVSYSKHSPSISSYGTYSAEEVHNSNPTNPVPDVVLNSISIRNKEFVLLNTDVNGNK